VKEDKMAKERYVLEATDNYGHYDGYYTGKSYIYQGSKFAVVNNDISKAKVYSSKARAEIASEMNFENYCFKAKKIKS
jgi:hypothetical protein